MPVLFRPKDIVIGICIFPRGRSDYRPDYDRNVGAIWPVRLSENARGGIPVLWRI